MSHPYDPEPVKLPVNARINLRGDAEFIGVRHRVDGRPIATIRICGVDIDFESPEESAAFASAAEVTAAQHHIAWERNGLSPVTPTTSAGETK
jgi:hypothetical protein